MPTPKSTARTDLTARLLGPVQKVIRLVLPDFVGRQLSSPKTRQAIVLAADLALVRQVPTARLLPRDARRRLIRRQLDTVIDNLLPTPAPRSRSTAKPPAPKGKSGIAPAAKSTAALSRSRKAKTPSK